MDIVVGGKSGKNCSARKNDTKTDRAEDRYRPLWYKLVRLDAQQLIPVKEKVKLCWAGGGAQHPVLQVNELKKTGARSAMTLSAARTNK